MSLPPSAPAPPQAPSLSWRIKSSLIMGMTGVLSRCFLYGLNRVEVTGLSRFLEVLDSRQDPAKRQRGLLTVSNHVSVLDDPVVWGILPLRYSFNPNNLRWTLGAADICFKNQVFSSFFTYGQVLPCHRLKHSPHGGPAQPTMSQALRLLSTPRPGISIPQFYTTTGTDRIPSPIYWPAYNRHAWIHVFPEGLVHQHPHTDLRYFKWGLARLILESEPAPDIIPMFIDGTQRIMPEDRTFPRFLPRIFKTVRIGFGEVLSYEDVFGDLRRRWETLKQTHLQQQRRLRPLHTTSTLSERDEDDDLIATMLSTADDSSSTRGNNNSNAVLLLRETAEEIRIECARRMRSEILKVRARMGGYPESDPRFALAETWAPDHKAKKEKRYRSLVDGSQINQD